MSRSEGRIVLIAGAWLATAAAANAATETTPPSGGLEEVIVTAQKRAESEQTVPLSITAFSAAALQQKAINDFFDYGTKVPNLAFAMTGDGVGTARTISIRGISGDNVTGFYIDDVPLPDSIDPRILDVDRIEVLRGPQGTLYGARSMGGTVRVLTKSPDLTGFSADVHVGVSDTWNTNRPNYVGDAVVNLPLVQDRLSLRVSGFYDQEAGFFKRRYCTDPATAGTTCFPLTTDPALTTTVDNVAAINTYGGTVELTWKATDALTITPRAMTQRADYNGFPMSDYLLDPAQYPNTGYPVPPPPVPPLIAPVTPNNFVQGRFFNIPEGGHDAWDLYSLTLHWTTGVGELVSSTAYFDRKVIETEDETDFIYQSLLGGFQALPSAISEEKNYQRFVEELRFASTLKGPLQYVVGFFYSDFHGRVPFAASYPPALAPGYGNILTNVFGSCLPPPAVPPTYLCPNPNNPDEIFGTDYRTEIKEPAVFGELSYEITSALKATVGLRWSHVSTTAGGYLEGSVTQSNTDYYATPPVGRIIDPDVTTKENSTTPKFQLDYRITPDEMVYTMIAKGFRPGGIVPTVPAALCAAELPAGTTVGQTRQYQSDSLWNYEIGTKNSWFDHRVTFNADAFYIDWKNIQQWLLLACGFQYRVNAASADSKGGEMEVNARPIEPLQLSLGVGYQDAKISGSSASSPQVSGDPVFQVPDWTGNAAISWTQPLFSADWNLVAGADYSYVGRSFSANNLSVATGFTTRERPAYRLVNARIALQHASWELAIVGKNIANEHANLGDSRSIAAETVGRPRILVNQPQTFGMEFRAHF
ncbi:MAG TPA: TonB-dependent receptor [Steroidobacteraceae bacterium]|nr:TonB-dependent receptor [Steroidobacteraceae bacterium]